MGYQVSPITGGVPPVGLGNDTVCAFHILAALEPEMVWFRKWMATARMAALLPGAMVECGSIHHMLYLCMHVLQVWRLSSEAARPSPSLL